jgi:group I intron endonuclease
MRQPLNYQNGKIYVIRNHVNEKVYVGSTTQSLSKRWGGHKANSKKRPNYLIYKAFEDLGIDNFYIQLIENYPCENKEQLRSREGFHMRKLNSYENGYNSIIAGRTEREYYENNKEKIQAYQKSYRESHAENLGMYRKQYYQDNKQNLNNKQKEYLKQHEDKYKAYQKKYRESHSDDQKKYMKLWREKNSSKQAENLRVKVKCECGSEVSRRHLARHYKTKIHQIFDS